MKHEKFPTSLLLNQQMFLYRTLVYLTKAFYTHSKSHSVRINQVFSQHDFYNQLSANFRKSIYKKSPFHVHLYRIIELRFLLYCSLWDGWM